METTQNLDVPCPQCGATFLWYCPPTRRGQDHIIYSIHSAPLWLIVQVWRDPQDSCRCERCSHQFIVHDILQEERPHFVLALQWMSEEDFLNMGMSDELIRSFFVSMSRSTNEDKAKIFSLAAQEIET